MLFLVLFSGVFAHANVITGYVGLPGLKHQNSDATITIRQPDKNIKVTLSSLPESTRKTLLDNDGGKGRVSVDIPKAAIVSEEKVPNAVRPDCSEMPFDYKDLTALANRPGIKNQTDFLKAIPPGTLQTFTFAFSSKSIQGPGISPEFPGIIRMSQDGKLVLRYTCDPTKPTYNKIEVLTYDDATEKYKMASINFAQPPSSHRIEMNPKSCLQCHNPGGSQAPIDPRPNWQAYNQWTGFYGSEDDTFKAGIAELGENQVTWEQMSEQKKNFLSFREKQKNNPCYSTLPWPPNPDELYPYGYQGRDPDYRRRPGLKFTEVQCHLTARRLARKFREKPEYNLVKYALAMNSLQCEQFRPDQITQIIPEAKAENFKNNSVELDELTVDQSTPNTSLSAHFEVGRAFGLRNADWTMHFNRPDKAGYICGINEAAPAFVYHHRDLTIGDLMQGELMKDLSKDVPALKDKIRTSPGERDTFGDNFACIDELGGAPGSDELNSYQVCKELSSAQDKLEKEVIQPNATRRLIREWQDRRANDCAQVRAEDSASANLDDLISVTGSLGDGSNTPSVERGRSVVSGVCIHCHDGSMGMYDFFSNEAATKNHLKEDPKFIERVRSRINSTTNPMPPTHPLSDMEKADLEAYLRTFLN